MKYFLNFRFLLIACSLIVGQVVGAQAYGMPEIVAQQMDKRLAELSGLAGTLSQPDYFWAINDSGNSASLILVNEQGQYQDEVELTTLGNHDWEDLETFVYEGINYIAIADIGDNFTRRKVYYVHLVPEPQVSKNGKIGVVDEASIQTIAFQYEDGPRDAEALGIDVAHQRVLLLTKRDAPPKMYSLPLVMKPKRFVYLAKSITQIPELGKMSIWGSYLAQSLFAGLPTSMTVLPYLAMDKKSEAVTSASAASDKNSDADITSMAILSYGTLFLFDLINESPVFVRKTSEMRLPPMPQAEAVAQAQNGDFFIMSERVGSNMVKIAKTK